MSILFYRSHPILLVLPVGTLFFGSIVSFLLFYSRESIVSFPSELMVMLSIAFLVFVVLFFGLQLASYYLTGLKIDENNITIVRFRAPFEYRIEKINNDHIASITSRKKSPLDSILDMGQIEFAITDGRIINVPYMTSPLLLAEKCYQASSLEQKQ